MPVSYHRLFALLGGDVVSDSYKTLFCENNDEYIVKHSRFIGYAAPVKTEQEALDKAIAERDLSAIFNVFVNDPLVTCSLTEAKALFKEMVLNTKEYLKDYDLTQLETL